MVIINQVGINTSFLDLGFNNLRKVPNLALRKLVKAMMVKIMMMMMMMIMMRQGHISHARSQICHRESIQSADTLYSSPVLYKYANAIYKYVSSMYKYDSK